jgi:hypothetical protein
MPKILSWRTQNLKLFWGSNPRRPDQPIITQSKHFNIRIIINAEKMLSQLLYQGKPSPLNKALSISMTFLTQKIPGFSKYIDIMCLKLESLG